MDILGKIAQVKALRARIPLIGERATVVHQKNIIDYYQREQVGQGLKAGLNGNTIQIGQYAPATEDRWMEDENNDGSMDKSAGNLYYMQWTGHFFDTMRVVVFKRSFDITSNAQYINFPTNSYFKRRYANIYDLTKESMNYVEKAYIAPFIDEFIRDEISRIV